MSYKMHVWTATNCENLNDQLRKIRDRVSLQNIEIARLRKENEDLRIKLERKPMAEKDPEEWTLDEVVGAMEHCGNKTCNNCPLFNIDACGGTLVKIAAKMLREMAG